MNKGPFSRLLPHLLAVLSLLLLAVIYCRPALSGMVLSQSDVTQWRGMAQQLMEFKEANGQFPLWAKAVFSGMPAYQIAMESTNPVTVGYFHNIFTLFLPKPVQFFFLASVSFYFLLQVFRINPRIAVLGAIAYAYCSYNPIIVETGHDTKMLAMCYLPALLGAVVLVYEGKYWLGGALTALFSALLIGMNHLQVSYYFVIIALFLTAAYGYKWFKTGAFRHGALALGITLAAGLTGVLANATNIFVTYDYSKATIRNGTLAIDTASGGQKAAGLPIDYAFQWSYGKAETFTLLVPGIYGGGSGGELGHGSRVEETLTARGYPHEQAEGLAAQLPTYWGPQPFTSGPVYLGAIVCALFLFGMVYLRTGHRWWILGVCVLAVLMSWGKYLEGFNTFLFNYLPLYNKFRAPSMTLIIPQLLFPLLGAMALQRFFFKEEDRAEVLKRLKYAAYGIGGLLLLAGALYLTASYSGEGDASLQQQLAGNGDAGFATEVFNALKEDRRDLAGSDLLRSTVLIALAMGLLFLFYRRKLAFPMAIAGLILLTTFDLLGVGSRYLNSRSYVEDIQSEEAFIPTPADQQINGDNSYYRVVNFTRDVFQDAVTSYHHNSIGGYHPAKLAVTEDLLSYQLRGAQPNLQVLNMLNTKYFILPDPQSGQPVTQQNPGALGPAWFVRAARFEPTAIAVMRALDNFNPRDTAVLFAADRSKAVLPAGGDSSGTVQLVRESNDELVYRTAHRTGGLAVFSEIFYDRGWTATIDGRPADILRVNYALRGLMVPAGAHEVQFTFRPASFYTGETVSLIANLIILAALLAAAYMTYRKRKANGHA